MQEEHLVIYILAKYNYDNKMKEDDKYKSI
jgi:hypothetical protein